MTKPCFRVDFNELVEPDLVLLSQDDHKQDSSGQLVELRTGLAAEVYEEGVDTAGLPDELFAQGVVQKNVSGVQWAQAAFWLLRIDSNGIRHRSEIIGRTMP